MSKQEANAPSPVSLSTMLGSGETFEAKGKTYTVKPIALKHIEEIKRDNLSVRNQLVNLLDEESIEKVDKWLGGVRDNEGKIRSGYCYDSKGNPVTLQQAMDDGWDVVDLRNFFQKLCDLSG